MAIQRKRQPEVEQDVKRELDQMEREPFLDVEKKLVGWSLGIGVVLLVVLVWLSYTFFPAH